MNPDDQTLPFEVRKQQFLEEMTTLSKKFSIFICTGEGESEPFLVEDMNLAGEYSLRGSAVGLKWRTEEDKANEAFDPRTPEVIALENDFDSFTGGNK